MPSISAVLLILSLARIIVDGVDQTQTGVKDMLRAG